MGRSPENEKFMRRPRCPYCQRPVGRSWLRCRVCGTKLWPFYALVSLAALAFLSLLFLFLFYEVFERHQP